MDLSQLIATRSPTVAERRLAAHACHEMIGHPDHVRLSEVARNGVALVFAGRPFTDADFHAAEPIFELMEEFETCGRRDAKYETFIVSLSRLRRTRNLSLMDIPNAAAYAASGNSAYFLCRDVLGYVALAWQTTLEEGVITTIGELAQNGDAPITSRS